MKNNFWFSIPGYFWWPPLSPALVTTVTYLPCLSPYPSFALDLISIVACSVALQLWPHLILYIGNKYTGKGGADMLLPSYLTLYLFFTPNFLRVICSSSGCIQWHQLIGLDYTLTAHQDKSQIKKATKSVYFSLLSSYFLFKDCRTTGEFHPMNYGSYTMYTTELEGLLRLTLQHSAYGIEQWNWGYWFNYMCWCTVINLYKIEAGRTYKWERFTIAYAKWARSWTWVIHRHTITHGPLGTS